MTVQPPTSRAPLDDPVRTVLSIASTPHERSLLADWVESERTAGPLDVLWDPDPDGLAERLAGDGSRFMFAARVAWLPTERGDGSSARWSDVVSVGDPWRP